VSEQSCSIGRGGTRPVHDRGEGVPYGVKLHNGDPGLPAQDLEAVAVSVGLDGLASGSKSHTVAFAIPSQLSFCSLEV